MHKIGLFDLARLHVIVLDPFDASFGDGTHAERFGGLRPQSGFGYGEDARLFGAGDVCVCRFGVAEEQPRFGYGFQSVCQRFEAEDRKVGGDDAEELAVAQMVVEILGKRYFAVIDDDIAILARRVAG